jgi:hypothetical protein
MTVGHPHPPEKVRPGVEAWKKALIDRGIDPNDRHCQFHVRTYINESSERAREIAIGAIGRYDAISRIGLQIVNRSAGIYDWDMMLATGETITAIPQCIENIRNAMTLF